jgi:hypothetical protein
MGVGMDRDRGHLVGTLEGLLVQGFDVGEHVLESIVTGVDEFLRQGVEHEGVIGIRGMGNANQGHGTSFRTNRSGHSIANVSTIGAGDSMPTSS